MLPSIPLIGLDPDLRVHVSERLRSQKDGPMLEALKAVHLTKLHLQSKERDHPDRHRLAERFDLDKALA